MEKANAYAAEKHGFFAAIGHFFGGFISALVHGDLWVKLSLLWCGAGYVGRKQYVRGFLATLLEAALLIVFPWLLWPYVSKLGTLGTVKMEKVFNMETMKNEFNNYDNSFLILLFGIIGVLVLVVAAVLWIRNMSSVHQLQKDAEAGRHINSFKEDVANHLNGKFHRVLLSLPATGVVLFTIVPLIVMVAVAFTNYDKTHLVPTNLFTWVGMDNFVRLFSFGQGAYFGYSFLKVLAWTLIWAFLATFTNYFGGILLAMFINNKKTVCKKLWRTLFVIAIAVPQFVSLMLVRNFFANTGIINTFCANAGILDFFKSIGWVNPSMNYIPFLTDVNWARPMIIIINMWVGIPYMMLIATGVLMNIPVDILESARIDGANAWQSFRKITMPYVFFVTGPYLVNQVVSNINNFNVIWLLTKDVYTTQDQLMAQASASETDLLVTWLFRMTQEQFQNYKMASVLGILIFVICAFFTLVAFRNMTKGDKEESFQ